MLTIHHLGKSQSERIIWLCEELELKFQLKNYTRNKVDILAPPEYKALHPMGSAPVINDGDLILAESGAIVEYILAKYGKGRLAPDPGSPDFAPYLYWFHFANGTLQPAMGRNLVLRRLDPPSDNPVLLAAQARVDRAMALVETRLGEAPYFAGDDLTAADIMLVFSLTTMRVFVPFDFKPYANILAYLQLIGARPAYQRAMHKGDPDMSPLLT